MTSAPAGESTITSFSGSPDSTDVLGDTPMRWACVAHAALNKTALNDSRKAADFKVGYAKVKLGFCECANDVACKKFSIRN